MANEPTGDPAVIGAPPPAHAFVDDPGGVFETDAHRRVLGHLPGPEEESLSPVDLHVLIAKDKGSPLSEVADITRVLAELEGEGYCTTKNGLRMTPEGFNAIQGESA